MRTLLGLVALVACSSASGDGGRDPSPSPPPPPLATGKVVGEARGDATSIRKLAFSGDGRSLVSLASDGRISRIAATGGVSHLAEAPDVEDIALSPNGETVALISGDRVVLEGRDGKRRPLPLPADHAPA